MLNGRVSSTAYLATCRDLAYRRDPHTLLSNALAGVCGLRFACQHICQGTQEIAAYLAMGRSGGDASPSARALGSRFTCRSFHRILLCNARRGCDALGSWQAFRSRNRDWSASSAASSTPFSWSTSQRTGWNQSDGSTVSRRHPPTAGIYAHLLHPRGCPSAK